jgi:hypothetical protein
VLADAEAVSTGVLPFGGVRRRLPSSRKFFAVKADGRSLAVDSAKRNEPRAILPGLKCNSNVIHVLSSTIMSSDRDMNFLPFHYFQ